MSAAPSQPKGPLKVSEVTADGCELKWQKPDDDIPVDHYVVERMDTEIGRWVPVCVSKIPEAEVTGLHEGKEYLFRVKAVNAEGESIPLETDFGVVAKNPYSEYAEKRMQSYVLQISFFFSLIDFYFEKI